MFMYIEHIMILEMVQFLNFKFDIVHFPISILTNINIVHFPTPDPTHMTLYILLFPIPHTPMGNVSACDSVLLLVLVK